ncbi:MAG: protease modulator HflC [Chloroflexi bacterium]|nr:protease modulator HflC [Chloroflexota bacterium]
MRAVTGTIIGIILLAILGPQFLFTVDETKFVVVTRFGEVQRIETTPGLKSKIAFIDATTTFEKRLLRVDVTPASIPDVDQQFLDIDAYVRYRITDPQKFLERLRDQANADSRISAIVTAELRAEIGTRNRAEIIGGRIITILDPDPPQGLEPDLITVVEFTEENGVPTRETITRTVKERANERVQASDADFGIEIVDVRIKRADFPQVTEENVFARMSSERLVQATRLRAEGEEEFRTITADVDRRVEIISADADRQSSALRGEGEAQAISILADALGQDPEFFAFQRSLEAYKKILSEQTTVVLPADSPLFQYLQTPQVPLP